MESGLYRRPGSNFCMNQCRSRREKALKHIAPAVPKMVIGIPRGQQSQRRNPLQLGVGRTGARSSGKHDRGRERSFGQTLARRVGVLEVMGGGGMEKNKKMGPKLHPSPMLPS